MREAMTDIANIVSRASQNKEKLNRTTFKNDFARKDGPKGGCPLLFVVIHALTTEQVAQNIKVAMEEGADGCFLINHDFDYPQLLPIIRHVRGLFPEVFLGTNFHTLNGAEAFPILGRLAREGVKIDAYWADNACIEHERPAQDQGMAQKILDTKASSGWDGLYFGGTAFKNPRNHAKLCRPVPPEACTHAASIATQYMDVVTTSGPDAGQASDDDKMKGMREGCKETPLAVASSLTAEDLAPLAPSVDAFLLHASVHADAHTMDAQKLRALVSRLRAP